MDQDVNSSTGPNCQYTVVKGTWTQCRNPEMSGQWYEQHQDLVAAPNCKTMDQI